MLLFYIILSLIATSIGSVLLSSILLFLNDKWLQRISSYLLYLAGGTLLGSALLGLLPQAAQNLSITTIGVWLLVGIMFFFLLEKILLWRSCADQNCPRKTHTAAPMIIVGDAFHNAIDGVVITGSFLISPELGGFVTLSVLLHEIPQEMGDFGILLRSGYSRRKALIYNLLSGVAALLAGIAAYFALTFFQNVIPYVIVVAAAGFLYIALADLIPEMHRESNNRKSLVQILLILAGIFIIVFSL
ncbi:MAG: ZIP family metal transporter [Paludibacter sp.]|jgi:zinc and cadmium transporter|nr:ZIP family metal transporter [Paludibacter sp.]